jgi:epoxyqueuosine reductase
MFDLSLLLRQRATELGFAAVGFMEPRVPPHFDRFVEWLEEEKHGDLVWLRKNIDLRQDPRRLLNGCRTMISLAVPYPAWPSKTPDQFALARYASSPIDYHAGIRTLCLELAHMLQDAFPGVRSRIFVDSGPVLERSIAHGAGLGFIGKNSMLIVPGRGSYVNLAEILTTALIDFDTPERMESLCGECNRCIQACPTGALEKPFRLNTAKCLSYLTVEFRGEIPNGRQKLMGNCFLGCDRCQEVCPFNREMAGAENTRLLTLPSSEELLGMDEATFSRQFATTALARPGLARVKRNLLAIRRDSPPSSPD